MLFLLDSKVMVTLMQKNGKYEFFNIILIFKDSFGYFQIIFRVTLLIYAKRGSAILKGDT